MTNTIRLLVIPSIIMTGCGLYKPPDPCKPGILYDNLTAQQQQNCQECGQDTECPESPGETGPGETGGYEWWCLGNDVDRMCYDELSPEESSALGWAQMSLDDCDAVSPPYDTYFDTASQARMCWVGVPFQPWLPASAVFEWTICEKPAPAPRWYEVSTIHDSIGEGLGYYNWLTDVECRNNTTSAGVCPLGPVSIHPGLDTCRCESDENCQIGAVCEAGYVDLPNDNPDHGLVPTLCIWNDAPGTWPLYGPPGYGLDNFEDGFSFIDDVIVIDYDVYPRLAAGLLDDAQDWSSDGVVTRCDEQSLCAWLGLDIGDIVSIPLDIETMLLAGEPVEITIDYGFGPHALTVVLGDV